jgi:uncharacterized protein (TIGR03067 family)
MRVVSVVTAFLATLLLLAADTPKKNAADADQNKLRGTWTIVSASRDGKPAPEDALKDARMIFDGDKLTAASENGKSSVLSIKLDSSRKPKTIDITHPEKKQTILGIYALEGDQLKLCLGTPGAARPTELATREGSGSVLFVLKREK